MIIYQSFSYQAYYQGCLFVKLYSLTCCSFICLVRCQLRNIVILIWVNHHEHGSCMAMCTGCVHSLVSLYSIAKVSVTKGVTEIQRLTAISIFTFDRSPLFLMESNHLNFLIFTILGLKKCYALSEMDYMANKKVKLEITKCTHSQYYKAQVASQENLFWISLTNSKYIIWSVMPFFWQDKDNALMSDHILIFIQKWDNVIFFFLRKKSHISEWFEFKTL